MVGDGNSSLWSGKFVRVGDERTSPTSYARTFKCVGLIIGFECISTGELLKFLSRLNEMRSGCDKISAVVGSC